MTSPRRLVRYLLPSPRGQYSTDASRIRNLGIIAHIDAGKTTTTERMLFYAGLTKRLGDVDRGDTVTDYLPEERERGITITAAAITFPWGGHAFNLIDTPGHVDFSMEVERSLRVLDGAVTILDGSAGVQAQTKTVWRQAAKYGVPRIIFVNKLDKAGADFERAVLDVRNKLSDLVPLCIQVPIIAPALGSVDGSIVGVDNLIAQQSLVWRDAEGTQIDRLPWQPDRHDLYAKRTTLLEQLAELDDEFLETYLALNGADVTELDITKAVRRLTIANRIAPVLCGAAAKNIGVQPVLDAVISFLPSPEQRPVALEQVRSEEPRGRAALLALAFKVIHDEQRGPLVFVRIYSGTLTSRMALRNTSRGSKERATRLLTIFANKFDEIEEAAAGSVVVLLGLKTTRTGDTLTAAHEHRSDQLAGIAIPPPVFTRSVEAESNGDSARLEEALRIIEMEDPSVRISRDPESGQKHLSGMGELHLEIVSKRLTRDLKAKAIFGDIQIAYKEVLSEVNESPIEIVRVIDREMMGKRMVAGLRLSVKPLASPVQSCTIQIQDRALVKESPDMTVYKAAPLSTTEGLQEALQEGLEGALQDGPAASFPLLGLAVTVKEIGWVEGDSSVDAFRYLAFDMLQRLLAAHGSRLAEPIMAVEITVPAAHLGHVLTDIHSVRRGQVLDSIAAPEARGEGERELVINAEIPLASMLGYASALRSKTAGSGSFTMHPLTYRVMGREEESRVLQAQCCL